MSLLGVMVKASTVLTELRRVLWAGEEWWRSTVAMEDKAISKMAPAV